MAAPVGRCHRLGPLQSWGFMSELVSQACRQRLVQSFAKLLRSCVELGVCQCREIGSKASCSLACGSRSGLVAAQEAAQPFEYCDVVTTTTHKSLRGPRGAA